MSPRRFLGVLTTLGVLALPKHENSEVYPTRTCGGLTKENQVDQSRVAYLMEYRRVFGELLVRSWEMPSVMSFPLRWWCVSPKSSGTNQLLNSTHQQIKVFSAAYSCQRLSWLLLLVRVCCLGHLNPIDVQEFPRLMEFLREREVAELEGHLTPAHRGSHLPFLHRKMENRVQEATTCLYCGSEVRTGMKTRRVAPI